MAPAPDGWLILDQGRRHFPAGPRLFRQSRRHQQSDRQHVPRRDPDRGPVRAERQMGVGMDRAADDRSPVPVRLPALSIHSARSIPSTPESPPRAFLSSISPAPATAAISISDRSTITASPAQDVQAQIPIIHPVLDYSNVLPQPVLGGEFSYKFNLTSLTRQQARIRRYQPERGQQRTCARPIIPPSSARPIACCAASPEPIRARPPRWIGAAPSSPTTAR